MAIELPEFLKPRLRLFLSADIIGSTALKQSPREREERNIGWYTIIQTFYAETQEQLRATWAARAPGVKHFDPGTAPILWKVIGDEITFSKILTDHRQVAFTLACWAEAIQQVRKFIRTRSKTTRLDVKCTAWTAGFPVMNSEVAVKLAGYDGTGNYFREGGAVLNQKYAGDAGDGYIVDFIGPSIDIGFRLSTHATQRKFVVSVGVAYILSITNSLEKSGLKDPQLRYEGAAPLKGVFGGAPYPIFWVDMALDEDLAKLEDQLTKPAECNLKTVEKYCEQFFEENSAYTFKPFIATSAEPELKARPDWYDGVVESLRNSYVQDDVPPPETEKEAEQEAEALGAPSPLAEPITRVQNQVARVNFDKLLDVLFQTGVKSISVSERRPRVSTSPPTAKKRNSSSGSRKKSSASTKASSSKIAKSALKPKTGNAPVNAASKSAAAKKPRPKQPPPKGK